jgi:uncharacterized protein YraI
MQIRSILAASALVSALAWSTGASAQEFAQATGNVNMRTGPGTSYGIITTIPAGAPIQLLGCPGWCQVIYAGRQGWVSSNYVGRGYAAVVPEAPYIYQPAPVVRYAYRTAMPPRAYWRQGRPWWDDRYDSWYDGRDWWYDGRWYDRPRSGISFEFGF